jgi:sensor histidine kinase YesM
MIISKEVIFREIVILAGTLLASVAQAFLMCSRCTTFRSYALVTFFVFLLWIFLWRGNSLLTEYLSRKISWLDFPVKRFLVGFVTTVVYTLSVVVILMLLFYVFAGFNFGGGAQFTIIFTVVLTLIISLFLHSREFLFYWKKAAYESVEFQRESISARYEALKNQVNPAFLFHSLNAMSSLVYDDRDQAVRYIKQLSDVYRYILDTREKEVAPVEEEARFLQSYGFLLAVRFNGMLVLQIDLPASDKFLPPLAVQLIIESAVNNLDFPPMTQAEITVSCDGKFVYVAHGDGWKNDACKNAYEQNMERIIGRYTFLTDEKVSRQISPGMIRVGLPLVEVS